MDRADSAIAQDVQLAEPGRWREGRKALGRVSLGYFSLHEQREVTRSPQASGSLCSKKQKLDSSLRWNDERKSNDIGFRLAPE